MSVQGIAPAGALDGSERRAPGARMALLLLLSINLFNYIDRQVLAAVEPNLRAELLPGDPEDVAKFKTGLLPFAFLLTYMFMAPVFGVLGDRMSRWVLIAVGVILWSLASGASGMYWPVPLAHAYIVLLITRCFVGIGEAAYGPVAPTIIADLYPVRRRGGVLAWFYLAIPVGSALGYALGGQMAHSSLGWRWAFYLVVPPGILLGLWSLFMREPPRGQADDVAATRPIEWRDYLGLLRIRSYVLNTLGMTAMTFAFGALGYWMPAYLIEERKVAHLGPLDPVTAFGVFTTLAGLIATLLGGWLGDRLRARFPGSYFLVSGLGMLVGFPMVLLVLFTPFPLAWLWIFLAVFFLFFNTGPTNTILANVTHPAIRSSAFALNIFVLHLLGDAISPPLIGYISGRSSFNVGFGVVSAMILVGGVFWLLGARYLEEDTRLAPTRLE